MNRTGVVKSSIVLSLVGVAFASCTIEGLPSRNGGSGDGGDGTGGEPDGMEAGSGGASAAAGSSAGTKVTGGDGPGAGGMDGAAGDGSLGGASAGGQNGAGDAGAGGEPPINCGDTMTDENNCGACGHVCSCGDCEDGKCQPTVITGSAPHHNGLAAAGDSAYFNYGPDLRRLTPPAAPSPTPLATVSSMWGVQVSSEYVYYTGRTGTGSVSRVPRAGGSVEPVAPSESWPTGIDVYENGSDLYVFWAAYNAGSVRGVIGTGSPFTVCSGLSTPVHVTAYDGRVYLTQPDGSNGKIHWCDVDPPASGDLVTGVKGLGRVKQRNGLLFWSATNDGGTTGTITRRVIASGATTTPISNIEPRAFALDDSAIYYLAGTKIYRASHTGANKAELAELANNAIDDMAVNDQCVFWTYGNGTIGRVDKD